MPLVMSRWFETMPAKRRSAFRTQRAELFYGRRAGRAWAVPRRLSAGTALDPGGDRRRHDRRRHCRDGGHNANRALVDRTYWKRALVVLSALAITAASIATLIWPDMILVSAAQVATGIAGAAAGAAIAAITLGLVRQRGFAHQLGRNQAYNHSGNVVAAALAGLTGYFFGLGAVFVVLSIMALFSVAAASAHRCPRDRSPGGARRGGARRRRRCGIYRAAALAPAARARRDANIVSSRQCRDAALLGQAVVAHGAGNPSAFTGATIVVAQITMIPASLLAARLAETRGYWLVLLIALVALPVRGVTASLVSGPWGLGPVAILDGVGAGVLGVAVPGLVARILSGTGRVMPDLAR